MLRRLFLLATAAALVGCAPLPKQAFNREAAGHIKSIAVTRQVNQDSYEAAVLGHPGLSFGLIGGLIAAADMAAKSSQLTKAIDVAETRLQERFADDLVRGLQGAGYEVTVVAIDKGTDAVKAVDAVRQRGKFDAMVYTESVGAYWAAGPNSNYVPRMLAKVKMVEMAKGATLFEDVFTYGYATPQQPTIHLGADARYGYANIDALVADPKATRQGLIDGSMALAAQIATDLKRP
jgi:hypothetical protein